MTEANIMSGANIPKFISKLKNNEKLILDPLGDEPTSKDRKLVYRIASVAAATASATPIAKVAVKNQKQINPILWVGLIFIFAGVSLIGYIYLKKNGKIRI